MGIAVIPAKGEIYEGIYQILFSLISTVPPTYIVHLYGKLIGFYGYMDTVDDATLMQLLDLYFRL